MSAGKRCAFRASDHDANWTDDSWTVSQIGPNNPKKLKKSKSKDESSQGSVMSFLISMFVAYNTIISHSFQHSFFWFFFSCFNCSMPVSHPSVHSFLFLRTRYLENLWRHKRCFGLKDDLLGFWWSEVKGHSNLTKHVFSYNSKILYKYFTS